MSDMDKCKHRWADSPSDAGEGVYCTRCGDMANVSELRAEVARLRQRAEEKACAHSDMAVLYSAKRKRAEAAEAKLRAVGELPEKWRKDAKSDCDFWPAEDCADELDALLKEEK